VTIAELTAQRDKAKEAYEAALTAQSYTLNMGGTSRSKTNQDVEKLLKLYEYWQAKLDRANGTTRRYKFGTVRL
jgi:hypothetical protein